MPDEFILEVQDDEGRWTDHGFFRAHDFERRDDGAYLCVLGAGSPLRLRCLRQDSDLVDVVDGGGEWFTYRLVPFPGGGYERT